MLAVSLGACISVCSFFHLPIFSLHFILLSRTHPCQPLYYLPLRISDTIATLWRLKMKIICADKTQNDLCGAEASPGWHAICKCAEQVGARALSTGALVVNQPLFWIPAFRNLPVQLLELLKFTKTFHVFPEAEATLACEKVKGEIPGLATDSFSCGPMSVSAV